MLLLGDLSEQRQLEQAGSAGKDRPLDAGGAGQVAAGLAVEQLQLLAMNLAERLQLFVLLLLLLPLLRPLLMLALLGLLLLGRGLGRRPAQPVARLVARTPLADRQADHV